MSEPFDPNFATNPSAPPTGAVPPSSPPPPGYPAGPPIMGGVPAAPPTAEIPVVPGGTAPPPIATPAPPSKLKGPLKIAGALLLTILLLGGAVAILGMVTTTTPRPEVTMEQCDIGGNGEVEASGTITNKDDEPREITLTVELKSTMGGTWSRTVKVVRDSTGAGGGSAVIRSGVTAPWSTTALAPESVQQVSCRVIDYSTK